MQNPAHFIGPQGEPYTPPERRGYASIEVLPFLKRKPWNEVALAYLHSLRPSWIRVVSGEETTDAMCWRVTVYVDENRVIETIKQEVEVALPDGVKHGQALQHALQYGLNSEQVTWHRDAKAYFYGPSGLCQKTQMMDFVPFPAKSSIRES